MPKSDPCERERAETTEQTQAITAVVGRMADSMQAVGITTGYVTSIALETAQATEAMRAGADQMVRTIESIAEVRDQGAAGAEEANVSTRQQMTWVQELAAGAQQLAQLAVDLQESTGRFVVPDMPAVRSVDGPAMRAVKIPAKVQPLRRGA